MTQTVTIWTVTTYNDGDIHPAIDAFTSLEDAKKGCSQFVEDFYGVDAVGELTFDNPEEYDFGFRSQTRVFGKCDELEFYIATAIVNLAKIPG